MFCGLDVRFLVIRFVVRMARPFLKFRYFQKLVIQGLDFEIRAREIRRLNYNLSRSLNAGSVSDLTLAEWLFVLRIYGCRCAFCGCVARAKTITMEHLKSIKLGGGTTLNNVVPACGSCNSRRSYWSRKSGIL